MAHITCVFHTHVNYVSRDTCTVCTVYTHILICMEMPYVFRRAWIMSYMGFPQVQNITDTDLSCCERNVRYGLYITGYYLSWDVDIMITAPADCRSCVVEMIRLRDHVTPLRKTDGTTAQSRDKFFTCLSVERG